METRTRPYTSVSPRNLHTLREQALTSTSEPDSGFKYAELTMLLPSVSNVFSFTKLYWQ